MFFCFFFMVLDIPDSCENIYYNYIGLFIMNLYLFYSQMCSSVTELN